MVIIDSFYRGDFYKGKKVLVTGHTGFKGSWLALWLLEMGAKVIGFSIDSPYENGLHEKAIKDGIIKAGTKADPGKPVNIVVAGGTTSPKGFIDFFKKTLDKIDFPIEIGEVRLAAESHQE